MNTKTRRKALLMTTASLLLIAASTRLQADQTGTCGGRNTTIPFDDVLPGNVFFCSIAEAFFSGLTNGTTSTTYSPSANVPREQMAAFITRTMDQSLKRGSRRAALNQFWTTTPQYTILQGSGTLATTPVGVSPRLVASDGADLWVATESPSHTVSRVRPSDGKLLETWTGATAAFGVVVAMGRVFVTGSGNPGKLYVLDPSQPVGAVTILNSTLESQPGAIAFDGQRLWIAHISGSVSIITPGEPFTVTPVGGFGVLRGIIYDGANIWVTEGGFPGHLKKLDASGNVLISVAVGDDPVFPTFDGRNLWVPNHGSATVSVVRPSDGMALANITGNGMSAPIAAAFDGERVLVTNGTSPFAFSLWKAADLTPLGFFPGPDSQYGACSDGLNFWTVLVNSGKLARF